MKKDELKCVLLQTPKQFIHSLERRNPISFHLVLKSALKASVFISTHLLHQPFNKSSLPSSYGGFVSWRKTLSITGEIRHSCVLWRNYFYIHDYSCLCTTIIFLNDCLCNIYSYGDSALFYKKKKTSLRRINIVW